jgi:hypothetical protein|tara:strand:+ start:3147 stop:3479 length:333 start_codon:yes stop_codon:yes gene_type:complete
MQDKYVDHYVAMALAKWFDTISDQVGSSPFGATYHNFILYPDPNVNGKLRIQSFSEAMVQLVDNLRDAPDPVPPPTLIKVGKFFPEGQAEVSADVSISELMEAAEDGPTS